MDPSIWRRTIWVSCSVTTSYFIPPTTETWQDVKFQISGEIVWFVDFPSVCTHVCLCVRGNAFPFAYLHGVVWAIQLRIGFWIHWKGRTSLESAAKISQVSWLTYLQYSSHDELLAHCAVSLRLDHICYDSAQTASPLRLSCYTDEDAMGQIKRLAREANPLRLDVQVLQRYSAYCCCRWLRQLTM